MVLIGACFATAQAVRTTDGKTAEQVYENIKVLRGTSADSFNQLMHLLSGQLGVDCEYCHLQKDRASDEVKAKRTARDMIRMTAEINKKSFEGKQVVTCYTCHHGVAVPVGVPVLPVADYPPNEKPAPMLPSADQILTKYVEALGGEKALQKVTTRVIIATQDSPTGPGGVIPVPTQAPLPSRKSTNPAVFCSSASDGDGFNPDPSCVGGMTVRLVDVSDSGSP